MKGMKIYGSFFNADSYQEVSIDRLTVPKYDNHGGGQAMLFTRDHGTRCAIGLLQVILSINWT